MCSFLSITLSVSRYPSQLESVSLFKFRQWCFYVQYKAGIYSDFYKALSITWLYKQIHMVVLFFLVALTSFTYLLIANISSWEKVFYVCKSRRKSSLYFIHKSQLRPQSWFWTHHLPNFVIVWIQTLSSIPSLLGYGFCILLRFRKIWLYLLSTGSRHLIPLGFQLPTQLNPMLS